MRTVICIVAVVFIGTLRLTAQPFPNEPLPWQDAYNISMADYEFTHPATVFNPTERDSIINRIGHKKEPQFSTYRQLLSEADRLLNFIPEPPASMNIMGGYEPGSNLGEMRAILWNNSYAAYTCALAYNISENTLYAEKAVEILNAWASVGTSFTGADRGLQLGSYFNGMLYAADLIHDYENWHANHRNAFEAWWRHTCLQEGDILHVMRTRDNNWKDAAILGVITAAVVFEDTLLLKEAVIQLTSYFYERTDQNVNNPGVSWKFSHDENGTYLLREVVRNEGSSGLTYTAYALTTMVQAMEIARNAGFDLWEKETAQGANMQKLISQYFDWSVLNAPFPWNRNPNKTPTRRNAFELANNQFDMGETFQTWLSHNRPLNGEQGDAWTTFTKGLKGETVIDETDSLKFERMYLEAEDAVIEPPMLVESDVYASNGRYVLVPDGIRSTGNVPQLGKTTFTAYLKGGTYRLWARVITPNPESDSYWVQINNQPAFFWNRITNVNTWTWVPVHQNNDTSTPWSFSVQEEEHSIVFYPREDNTKMDMIFIANDGSYPDDNDPEVVLARQYALILNADPSNGGYTTGSGSYPAGVNITLSATAYKGYVFIGWTNQNQEQVVLHDNVFTMPDYDVVLTANFETETTNIDHSSDQLKLNVYPNPTNGLTIFEFPVNPGDHASLQLINISGQTVFMKKIEGNISGREIIDLTSLGKGLYLVLFYTNNQNFSTKIQIE